MRSATVVCALAFAATAFADEPAHLLVAVQGKVMLKRPGWTAFAPAAAGTVVHRGDLVRVPSPGRATVACADLSVHELPAGKFSGVPCPAAESAVLVYEGSLLNPTRSDAGEDVPVVIAPRRTKLLSSRPTLRWAPMPGVAKFTVAVRGGEVNWTKEVSDSTSVVYPADAPELKPGVDYKVTVIAGERSSDEISEPGLGFSIAGEAAAREIRAEAERIRTLGLPDDAAQLLTVHLYASRGLHAEAIEQLEAIAKSRPTPRVWQTLGSLYQAAGLHRLAEEKYLQAAKQSRDADDIEGQALAHRALGVLYQDAFGLDADAKQSFTAALALFEQLGDAAAVRQMKEKLAHESHP